MLIFTLLKQSFIIFFSITAWFYKKCTYICEVMLWKPYTRSGSFLYQRDVKIVHDFDAIFLIYKPIIDVLMKKSSLIDLNVFRKVLIVLGYFLINCWFLLFYIGELHFLAYPFHIIDLIGFWCFIEILYCTGQLVSVYNLKPGLL